MKETNQDIEILIAKFLAGEASPEEAIELEDWKNASRENLSYYLESEKVFTQEHEVYRAISAIDTQSAWKKWSEKKNAAQVVPLPQRNSYKLLKIAASLLLLLSLSYLLFYFLQSPAQEQLVYSSQTLHSLVRLSDGSQVNLLPNSSITLDTNYNKGKRLLYLTGSAEFNVVHDESSEFIVAAGNLFVKDIGTRFRLFHSEKHDSLFIVVKEGIVSVFDKAQVDQELKAGDSACYVHSLKKLTSLNVPDSHKITATFTFNESLLGDVVNQLNETFHTTIVLENPSLKNCKITTQFKDESLENILFIISETLNLKIEKSTNSYILTGLSCR